MVRMNMTVQHVDVEGEEYKFLDLLIQNSHKFSSICMEFHCLNEENNFDALLNFPKKSPLKHHITLPPCNFFFVNAGVVSKSPH